MSSICLCMTEIKDENERAFCQGQMEKIAKAHGRGIAFYIDWSEPIVECLEESRMIVSLNDGPGFSNCEWLVSPDNWYINGKANEMPFRQRMRYLQEIAEMLLKNGYRAEFYIALSGTNLEEYSNATIRCNDLVEYLERTVGSEGPDDGWHITVVPDGPGKVDQLVMEENAEEDKMGYFEKKPRRRLMFCCTYLLIAGIVVFESFTWLIILPASFFLLMAYFCLVKAGILKDAKVDKFDNYKFDVSCLIATVILLLEIFKVI